MSYSQLLTSHSSHKRLVIVDDSGQYLITSKGMLRSQKSISINKYSAAWINHLISNHNSVINSWTWSLFFFFWLWEHYLLMIQVFLFFFAFWNTGFNIQQKVKIISEELAYNKVSILDCISLKKFKRLPLYFALQCTIMKATKQEML